MVDSNIPTTKNVKAIKRFLTSKAFIVLFSIIIISLQKITFVTHFITRFKQFALHFMKPKLCTLATVFWIKICKLVADL